MNRPTYASVLLNAAFLLFLSSIGYGQVDSLITDEEEEDYSMYDNLEFAGEATKRFASAKIKGLSPAKFISLGYDHQFSHRIEAGEFGDFEATSATVRSTGGIRAEANIPVISKNSVIIQVGARYWEMGYDVDLPADETHPLLRTLNSNGLRSMGLNTTIFKPINEFSFILVQLAADMNGDFSLTEFQGLNYIKYSGAALWGRRPNDNCQWAFGVSRTFRAGEMNIIPVLLYNRTSINGRWGTEMLLPARGHVRYTINSRNMLFAGFELEGNSYRIGNRENASTAVFDNHEIRRGELRFRGIYERQLIGFFWISAQAGYRVNYSYNVDQVPNGPDFYRGFFGTQPFAMENRLTNPLYALFSINLVSP